MVFIGAYSDNSNITFQKMSTMESVLIGAYKEKAGMTVFNSWIEMGKSWRWW